MKKLIAGVVVMLVVALAITASLSMADQTPKSDLKEISQIVTDHAHVFGVEPFIGSFYRIKSPPPIGVEPVWNKRENIVRTNALMRQVYGEYAMR